MAEINQQTIADRLEISRATVSRCFTNHAGISPVTRAKVFQLAAEIGYTHMETRSAPKKRVANRFRFNVLICSDEDEFFRGEYESPGEQILAGVSEYAQTHGASVDVTIIPPKVSSIKDPVFQKFKVLKDRCDRGILLIYPFPQAVIDQLALRFPLVSLVDQFEHNTIDCVDIDHYQGISTLVEHLVDAGHRRIGFYTRDYPIQASWSYRRYTGYLEKMTRLKLKVDPYDIIGMFPRPPLGLDESIAEAAERTRLGVTAWVCAADHQAFDLISGFRKHGLQVPKDVTVTGFDGIKRAGSNPSLTTIQVPFRAIGMTGAERLASRLRKRFENKQHIFVSGTLRMGKTVAHPPGES